MQSLKFSSLKLFFSLCLVILSFGSLKVFAQVIVLKDAKDAPVPIAIQGFLHDKLAKEAIDLEATLTADLIFSRLFKVIPSEAYLEDEIRGGIENIQVGSWRQVGADYLVRAKVTRGGNGIELSGYVFSILSGQLVLQSRYTTKKRNYEVLAHQFGDDIVKIVTGEEGLFSTKIAFAYQPPIAGRNKEIWMMDFNGRNEEPIVQNGRVNLSPAWTRDGKALVFSSAALKDWHLWITDLKGKSRQISKFPGSALGPAMLPNGKEMVVALSKDGNPELYVMNFKGEIRERLTKRNAIDIGPSVSPDGKRICFSSGQLGALHIFEMELKPNAKANRLTRVGSLNDSCAWHPTENWILFSGLDLDREFDIFKMNASGNNMSRLTYDAKNNETPNWSPDGNLIVYSSRETGRNEIWVMKADGTQKSKITNLPGDASQPDWSPRLGY
ncbi:MAG: hypothetical protein ACO3LE_05885 [Bdellovibrionota bacterium]